VPAIGQDQLNCAIYLYGSVAEAKSGANAGGSGFLIGLPTTSAGWAHTYAVTNKHVIDAGCHVLRINTRDGKSDTIQTKPADWTCSREDDLAVLPIDLGPEFIWDTIREDSFVTKRQVAPPTAKFDITFGVGDEVVFIGRVITHDG
jgi:S1-C subfamily serine protease